MWILPMQHDDWLILQEATEIGDYIEIIWHYSDSWSDCRAVVNAWIVGLILSSASL